jgi:hypothetical protein
MAKVEIIVQRLALRAMRCIGRQRVMQRVTAHAAAMTSASSTVRASSTDLLPAFTNSAAVLMERRVLPMFHRREPCCDYRPLRRPDVSEASRRREVNRTTTVARALMEPIVLQNA